MEQSTLKRFYLITYPRTCSNLLVRMLGIHQQPNMTTGDELDGNRFLPAFTSMGPNGLVGKDFGQWTEDEKAQMKQEYQDCFDRLLPVLNTAAAEGKTVFMKEHIGCLVESAKLSNQAASFSANNIHPTAQPEWVVTAKNDSGAGSSHTNTTVLPDDFLQSWYPTFIIRHPARAYPSYLRILEETHWTDASIPEDSIDIWSEGIMTLRWTRQLYEWYAAYFKHQAQIETQVPVWPIILDADDIMRDPKVVMNYAQILGLDTSKVSFSWKAAEKQQVEKMDPYAKRFLSTLLDSKNVEQNKIAGNVDLENETRAWRGEFGEKKAGELKALVCAAMEDYEFLKTRRLRA
ncbi:hypothetical protein BJX64DRAFT_291573 [Aspergillus heterothallicus]